MTASLMKASRTRFPQGLNAIRASLIVGGGFALTACIANPFVDAKVDPASPVAEDVARLTRGNAEFPKFSDMPKPPGDVRPAQVYANEAAQLDAAGAELVRATEPGTWTLDGTEAFASRAQAEIGPAPPPISGGDAEAYARALRERATPPPPR